MTPEDQVVRAFVSKFDERLSVVYGYISSDCPENAKEWYEDVELLMKLALRSPIADSDRARMIRRGRPHRGGQS